MACVLGVIGAVAAPAGAFLIDDFSASDPTAGFQLDLAHSDLLINNLETALPPVNVHGGARYTALDWQGIPLGLGPFPGDFGRLEVNEPSPGGVARVTVDGDPRVQFGYGRAAGVAHAFGPEDWTTTDILKLTLASSVSEEMLFGLFLWGELLGATQVYSSAPFALAAGETELLYDLPNSATFTAFDSGGSPSTVTVGDLLGSVTGLSVVWKGWDNPDAVTSFDLDQIEMVGSGGKPGDFDDDGDVDPDDVDILCDNMGGDLDPYDLDNDGDVDEDDLILHIEALLEYDTDGDGTPDGQGTFRGDFNTDGAVDLADLVILRTNAGLTGIGYAGGNANCDDVVDLADLTILRGTSGSIVSSTPEPASLGLLAVGAAALLSRRRATQ